MLNYKKISLALLEFKNILNELTHFQKNGFIFVGLLLVSKILNSTTPFFIKMVVDDAVNQAIYLGALFFLFKFLSPIFSFSAQRISVSWMKNLSLNYWRKHNKAYWQQNLSDIENKGGATQVEAMNFGITSIRFIVGGVLIRFFPIALEIVLGLTLLAITVSVYISLFVFMLLCFYATSLFFSQTIEIALATQAELETKNKNNNKSHQAFLSTSFIKSFHLEKTLYERAEKDYNQEILSHTSSKKMSLKTEFVEQIILAVSSGLIFIFCVHLLKIKQINVGDFALILFVWSQVTGPFVQLSWLWREGISSLTHFSFANDQYHQNLNNKNAFKLTHHDKNYIDVLIKPCNNRLIFDEFKIKFYPQQNYVIYGPIGSGKSIFLKSLLGHYPVDYGHTYIPNNTKTLLVAQNAFPFGINLMDCLKLCNKKAYTDEQIMHLVTEIGIPQNSLYENWDNSYCPFSGGQKSLVLLACAILSNPQYLFLDEVTSAMDFETEKKAYDVLRKYLPSTSIIMVAHRLNNALWVDFCIGIEGGKIKEKGRMKEMLNKQSLLNHLLRFGS